jgi:hypothetical protein
MAFNTGSISLGAGSSTTAAGIGGIGGGLAGFATSTAGLGAGALLASMGLMRGGKLGAGMSAGGGALVGAALGTMLFPGIGTLLGAGIGAAIGGGAGLIRMLFKGAQEKARQKIKATYGVDISDHGVLKQIVDMAKQGFGGNLDMAIRSQQIRDLVELYAMSTGASTSGLPGKMSAVSLMQSGGAMYQMASTGPGASYTTTQISPSTNVRLEIPVAIDGKVIENIAVNAVIRNGRLVSAAATSGIRSSSSRRELTALQLSPGTLTA